MNTLIKAHQKKNLFNELNDQVDNKEEESYKIKNVEKLLTTKSIKSNKKISNNIPHIIVELEHYRRNLRNVEKQQRPFDKCIQDKTKIFQDKL
ncbi:unnamed protein product [Rotaria sp. Silwood2]|nr:unnamed protein product [Rotaria sp. Silwood2]